MREKWQKQWEDEITYENDANDFFYEWVELKETRFVDLFEEWLGVCIGQDVPVKIKARKGSLFITVIKEEKKD